MPSIDEVKLTALIAAATSSSETASANLSVATAASDAAHRAIEVAVRAGGYDSFEIGTSSVTVPARLRSWSAAGGIAPPGRVDIGLGGLVSTWKAASAATVRRQNELAGLKYVLDEAKGLLAAYPPAEEDILPGLQTMLTAIQASMVAP